MLSRRTRYRVAFDGLDGVTMDRWRVASGGSEGDAEGARCGCVGVDVWELQAEMTPVALLGYSQSGLAQFFPV